MHILNRDNQNDVISCHETCELSTCRTRSRQCRSMNDNSATDDEECAQLGIDAVADDLEFAE